MCGGAPRGVSDALNIYLLQQPFFIAAAAFRSSRTSSSAAEGARGGGGEEEVEYANPNLALKQTSVAFFVCSRPESSRLARPLYALQQGFKCRRWSPSDGAGTLPATTSSSPRSPKPASVSSGKSLSPI
ncbi:hypothetical protein L596_018071 [Steinernema carpocapsae]|uniref:Uncharacterized protein n=1 Tax=Steinernema carpocapsae TaxID=34508 RepID=A0A4U5N3T3_STECR|nr:hypothetical protein L596_018071 [Steinernema carpocapsae]